MLPANLNIKQNLMEIPLPPPLSQSPNLIIIQPPPNDPLKLLLTNLLIRLALLRRAQLRLEPRLHAHAHSRLKGNRIRVTADLNAGGGFAVFFYCEEGLAVAAVCLEGECPRDFWGGNCEEGFVVADCRSSCGEKTMCIGGEVSGC